MEEMKMMMKMVLCLEKNKAGYTATPVAFGWAGAVIEKVTSAFGQEQWAQKAQKRWKSKKGINQLTDQPTDGQSGV